VTLAPAHRERLAANGERAERVGATDAGGGTAIERMVTLPPTVTAVR